MKKAQEFLVDSKLGEKKFDLNNGAKPQEQITLSIEDGGITAAQLQGGRKFFAPKSTGKNFFQALDEKVRSFTKPVARDKAAFFRLLAIMINAGIPLIQSLDTIMAQTLNQQLKLAIFAMARDVERGTKFSQAMAAYPKIFSEAQSGMIKAGEASGQLNMILRQIADSIEKTDSIIRKVRSAMIYPAFIVVVMILVVTAMMIFVVPKISELFASSGKELPPLTRAVIATSNFMIAHWALLIGGAIGIFIAAGIARRTEQGKYGFDWFALHVPAFGPIIQKSILARFSRSLGNLLSSGIPILEGLHINSKTVDNTLYEHRIRIAMEDVARGIPLGESLKDSWEFPNMVVQMVSVGEQTAQLDTIAQKIAEYYEDEVDTAVAGISKVIEPFIIVIIGGVVGVIVAAIMMPIIQLTDLSSVV